MDPAKWQSIKGVMSALLDLPENERTRALSLETDEEIRIEVEKLLAADSKAQGFIDRPFLIEHGFAGSENGDDSIGREIDDYVILEKISAGGMGSVFLAERIHSDFKQRVALKLIKRGMDSEAILKRFATERRILSTLKHPNIAALIDGGISSEGLPYFVMEYVVGKPLTQFCRENDLSLEARLRIFHQICEAVEHAHRNLVVHRDLKPSNILVTEDGTPKLLDFGIAKLLTDDDLSAATLTQGKIFTPEYASPEQILGKPVTTSTDVYSLGVILYELLVTHRPYDVKGRSFAEIVESVCETEPPKPSETSENPIVTADNEPGIHKIPKNQLRGDIDNIVLKALRKEPSERYGSVRQFADDVLRFLEGLPILARPQTIKYRFGKYVKRHKVGVFAAGLVLFSLIGGISIATWQAIVAQRERAKAERRFNDVRQLANSILFDHYDRIKTLPGATEARAKLVTDALTYLDMLAQDSADDPSLQRELVAAYSRMAEVQGGGDVAGDLGAFDLARENYLKAIAIQERLAASNPANIEDQRVLAGLYLDASGLMVGDDLKTLKADFVEKAVTIYRGIAPQNPDQRQAKSDLAKSLWYWAEIIRVRGNNAESINVYGQAAAIYEELGIEGDKAARYRRNAALSYKNIGAIHVLDGNNREALKYFQKAVSIDNENFLKTPDNVDARMDLSFSRQSLGEAYIKLDDRGRAIEEFKEAISLRESVFNADRQNQFAARSLFRVLSELAGLYTLSERFEDAESTFRRAENLIDEKLTSKAPTTMQGSIAQFHYHFADLMAKRASKERNPQARLLLLRSARSRFESALDIYQRLRDQQAFDPAFSGNLEEVASKLREVDSSIAKLSGK